MEEMINLRLLTTFSGEIPMITDPNTSNQVVLEENKETKTDSVATITIMDMMTIETITITITKVMAVVEASRNITNTNSQINNCSDKELNQDKTVDPLLRNHQLNFMLHQVERPASNYFESEAKYRSLY